MLISTLKQASMENAARKMPDLISDFKRNFRPRIVMLFVNTFVLSCETGFLNGDTFNRAIHIREADDWERFKEGLS